MCQESMELISESPIHPKADFGLPCGCREAQRVYPRSHHLHPVIIYRKQVRLRAPEISLIACGSFQQLILLLWQRTLS
jgi:hypothetical protein